MQPEIVLEDCPHCGGDAKFAGLADWPCKCMIGCFGESGLALGVAAHLAAAKPNIFFLDLDSAYDFTADPVIGDMTYDETVGGLIYLTDESGHGAVFDEPALGDRVSVS